MIKLLGPKDIIQTIRSLSVPTSKINDNFTIQELRSDYLNFLRNVQPEVPHFQQSNPVYVIDDETKTELTRIFSIESLVDDAQYDVENLSREKSQLINSKIKTHVDELAQKHQEFSWIFNLVIDSVFSAESKVAAGGTTSSAVGKLWVNPREDWRNNDVYEFLIHELTHTLIFIYEWRYGLYNDPMRLLEPSTYALSAIRNKKRPMDKALHSAIVGTEILLYREGKNEEDYKLHPSTKVLTDNTFSSLLSIKAVSKEQNFLTTFGESLVEKCLTELNAFKVHN